MVQVGSGRPILPLPLTPPTPPHPPPLSSLPSVSLFPYPLSLSLSDPLGAACPLSHRTHGTGGAYGRVTIYNSTHMQYDHVQNVDGKVTDSIVIVADSHGPF